MAYHDKHERAQASGLVRVRTLNTTRRAFLKGAAATGVLATTGLPARAAQTEVTFVGWQGYDQGLSADDFLQKQDIALNTTYIGNNDEIIAKLTAGGLGQIDLVTPYMGYIPLMTLAGLLEPIDESLVPNLANVIEPFKSDSNLFVDNVRYGVPFTWGSAPMIYNPATLPEPPAGWNALLEPRYKNRIGMMDDPLGNIMDGALAVTDAEVVTQLTSDQLEKTIDFLIAMKKQSRLYASSWGELADALARGDIDVTFSGWEAIKKFAADKGTAVEIHFPVEGTHAWLDNYCIAKDAPNREIAHELANQILSVDAQLEVGDGSLQGIVNPEAIAKLGASKEVYSYDDMDGFAEKANFYAFPPLEKTDGLTTWEDWQDAYQRFRSS